MPKVRIDSRRTTYLPCDDFLRRPETKLWLGQTLKALRKYIADHPELREKHCPRKSGEHLAIVSRRRVPDVMTDVIVRAGSKIRWKSGHPFKLPTDSVDAVFKDDGSFRILSKLEALEELPKQQADAQTVPVLRLVFILIARIKPDWLSGCPGWIEENRNRPII